MSESAQQLIDSALQLAPADRAVVANAILASLESKSDTHESPEIREAWSDEISNRIADIDSGRVKLVPSSEVWKRIGGKPSGRT